MNANDKSERQTRSDRRRPGDVGTAAGQRRVSNVSEPFFHRDGDWYIGNGSARGPWDAEACHAGPVTGVLARVIETAVTDKQLARVTANFSRPIPVRGFRVDTEIVRNGRAAAEVTATLRDREDRVCAVTFGLLLGAGSFTGLPSASMPGPDLTAAGPGRFPVERAMHGQPFFGASIEVAYPPGETGQPGPTTMWMRTPAIIEGENPSPFQRLCPIADCGNGISRNAEFTEATFINPDLTVAVFRLPESDWIASQATSFWEPTGIGMSHAMLFDDRGPVGAALQTLIVRPRDQASVVA